MMNIDEIVSHLGGEIREKQLKELIKKISEMYGDDDEDDKAFGKIGELESMVKKDDKEAGDKTGEEPMEDDDREYGQDEEALTDKVRQFFQPDKQDSDKDITVLREKPKMGMSPKSGTMDILEAKLKSSRGRPKGYK
jgi:hypothetical protein